FDILPLVYEYGANKGQVHSQSSVLSLALILFSIFQIQLASYQGYLMKRIVYLVSLIHSSECSQFNDQDSENSQFRRTSNAPKNKNDFGTTENPQAVTADSNISDRLAYNVMLTAEQFSDEAGCSGVHKFTETPSDSDTDSFEHYSNLVDSDDNSEHEHIVSNEDEENQTSQKPYSVPEGVEFSKNRRNISNEKLTRKKQRNEAEWNSTKAKNATDSDSKGVGKSGAPIIQRTMGLGFVHSANFPAIIKQH
ncbi:hypothetical protein TSAR_016646, partial [Trichomalopsis sarcophagae]